MTHDLLAVHTSDLHIDGRFSDEFHPLCRVLETSRGLKADLLILAGDIFDHNRVPLPQLDRVSRMLNDTGMPVVILPGNHDPITPDSVYRRGGLADVPNVHVLGVTSEDTFLWPERDLEVWGRAHRDYGNMSPLSGLPERKAGRRIAVAHGHWLQSKQDEHRGWLITDDDIAASDAAYVALGHWPQAGPAGDGRLPAYYSGSPDLAATVNALRLTADGIAIVERVGLADHRE
ncbi:MAG TPA: metallophosphoesterase [Dehalococcoidia bacterium]|nr:metallophosphoesterase [Dehalococcoidia bacterium]